MFPRLIRWGSFAVAVAALRASDSPPVEAQPATAAKADYILHPGDLLRVQVFQEDDLTREVRVSQENSINLPLIGSIDVKGKNLQQLRDLIHDLYDRDYLVNPQVNVFILEYAKRSVNVLGSVNTPGVVLFPQELGMTMLDAIARVGGFTRLADRKHVKLTRTVDGKTTTYVINADDIIQGSSKDSWVLMQDDVIFVPERLL